MKKVSRWHIFLIGIGILLLAGLTLWWGFWFTNTMLDRVLAVVGAVLLLFVSSIFLIIFSASLGKRFNPFLYDKKIKKEIAVEDLTFEKIRKFLDLYMGFVFKDKKHIFFSDFRRADFLASVPKEYHPLFLMRWLSIWMKIGTDNQWKQFVEADKENIDTIVQVLCHCGEQVISSKLLSLRDLHSRDDTDIEEFFLSHIDYFQEFILNYVKENIDAFNPASDD